MKIPMTVEQQTLFRDIDSTLLALDTLIKITPFKRIGDSLMLKYKKTILKRAELTENILKPYNILYGKKVDITWSVLDHCLIVFSKEINQKKQRKTKVPDWKWYQAYHEWFLHGKPIETIAFALNVCTQTVYAAFKERNLPYKNIK